MGNKGRLPQECKERISDDIVKLVCFFLSFFFLEIFLSLSIMPKGVSAIVK